MKLFENLQSELRLHRQNAAALLTTRNIANGESHRGFTLIEMIVSSVLLTAVFVTVVPLLGWVAAQHRMSDQRQFALQEVGNTMEQIAQMRRAEITNETLNRFELSEEASRYLREAVLEIKISELSGPPATKRVGIELSWKNRAGEYVAPVRLTAWIVR